MNKEEKPLMIPYVVYDEEQKRKQKIIYILIGIIFVMVAGWLVYSCIPTYETVGQESYYNENTEVNQHIGE
jgi:heme/copper-type cytochrome/quinol oxidase subunit 2